MLRPFALLLSKLFFRKIVLTHASNAPQILEEPCLWVANHPNGVLDAVVSFAHLPNQSSANKSSSDVKKNSKNPLLQPISKSSLFSHPVLKLFLAKSKAIPVFRQQDFTNNSERPSNKSAFSAVVEAFKNKGHILIFPEGISHDFPKLAKLKTGAARMILESLNAGVSKIILQPFAIEFSEKDVFRSQVYIETGLPIEILASNFQSMEAIHSEIESSLTSLCLEFNSWHERRNAFLLFFMVKKREPACVTELKQFYNRWRTHFENPEAVLNTLLSELRHHLANANISVEDFHFYLNFKAQFKTQLAHNYKNSEKKDKNIQKFVLTLITSVLLFVPSQLAKLFWQLPLNITRFLANYATSDRDILGTMKLAYGLIVFPTWMLGIFFLMWMFGLGGILNLLLYAVLLIVCTICLKLSSEHSLSPRILSLLFAKFFTFDAWKQVNESWHKASLWVAEHSRNG